MSAKILAIGFLGVGFSPKWRLDEVPKMPKQRYGVMTRYMPQVGSRGLDMMYRTATVQVNLDFGSEADMVQKLRVSLALAAHCHGAVCVVALHGRRTQRLSIDAQRSLARYG